jgi:hypothetical protein
MSALLEIFNLSLSIFVLRAFQSSIVTNAINLTFHTKTGHFATNPANTLHFAALKSIENEAIINIAESIKNTAILKELNIEIKNKKALIGHRNILSHPSTIVWNDSNTQSLFQKNEQYSGLKIALIYDMQRSLNQQLTDRNLKNTEMSNLTSVEMIEFYKTILKYSLKNVYLQGIGTDLEIYDALTIFKDKIFDFAVLTNKSK